MTDSVIRSRIDPALKHKASVLFHQMGMSMSDAIRLFLTQAVIKKSMPFPIEAPNAKTKAALAAADRGEVEVVTLDGLTKQWHDACAK